jgi:hypothetical protein
MIGEEEIISYPTTGLALIRMMKKMVRVQLLRNSAAQKPNCHHQQPQLLQMSDGWA